jgi:hypothetical protein
MRLAHWTFQDVFDSTRHLAEGPLRQTNRDQAAGGQGVDAAWQPAPLLATGRNLPPHELLLLESVKGRVQRTPRHAPCGIGLECSADAYAMGVGAET